MRASRGRSRLFVRRFAGALSAAILLSTLTTVAGADTKSDLQRARADLARLGQEIDQSYARLGQLDAEIADQEARLVTLQGELDELAAQIDAAQSQYARTQARVEDTKARLASAQDRYRALRKRLDQRARQTYTEGPSGTLALILGSSSIADLTDRVEFVNELSENDAELANQVQNRANELAVEKAELVALKAEQARALAELEEHEAAIAKKFAEATGIRNDLEAKRAEQAQLTAGLGAKHDEMLGIVDSLQKKLRAEEIAAAREAARLAAEEAARREAARLAAEAEEEAERLAAEKAAEEAAQEEEENSEPDPEPTDEPDPEPTEEPDPEPTEEPDPEPTEEPDPEPTDEPDPEPTDDPDDGNTPPPSGSGPFYFCPVDQSRSYVDSFGAPRVGHVHAGNDIMADFGTPIRAPFAGNAVASSNSLGGLTVHVYGSQGYVYNAHLQSYGTTGSVSAGTIIGYVGDSGNASGGPPHNHFEWHPDVIPADPWTSPYGYSIVGDAIDPYPYLNAVC